MPKFIDLVGQRYGRLSVLSVCEPNTSGKLRFLCRCDCGKFKKITSNNLRTGVTKSCGCLVAEVARQLKTTHGLSHHFAYPVWRDMIRRCEDPQHPDYPNYGGRGITVCDDWKYMSVFVDWAEQEYPRDHHKGRRMDLDRIDNSKGYSPENCRFISRKYNLRNTRRNRRLTYNGETRCVAEWAELAGMKYNTLCYRLNTGWTLERALTTPVKAIGGSNVE